MTEHCFILWSLYFVVYNLLESDNLVEIDCLFGCHTWMRSFMRDRMAAADIMELSYASLY